MTTVQRTAEGRNRDNPGLKFCIWPKAFVHAAQTVVDSVFKAEALNQSYRHYTGSNDVQVTKVVKPTFGVEIKPRELTWRLDNASVTVRGQKKDQYHEENFEKRVSGSFDVDISIVRSGPFDDPIYSADVNMDNFRSSYSLHDNGVTSINTCNFFTDSVFNDDVKSNRVYNGDVNTNMVFNGDIKAHMVFNGHVKASIVFNGDVKSTVTINGDVKSSITINGDVKSIITFNGDVKSSITINGDVKSIITINGDVFCAIVCNGDIYYSMVINGKVYSSSVYNGKVHSCCQSMSQSNSGKRILYDAGTLNFGTLGEPSAKRSRNDGSITHSPSATDHDFQRTFIRALENAVLERLNRRLPVYSFPVGSSCDWMFDFSTLSKPKFQNRYLESTHLGAICNGGDNVMLPLQAAPFPEPQNSGRMLTIFISNYVINTIGYYLHQQNILNYNLTQADLIPQATGYVSTTDTSEGTGCLSDCFPDFSEKYPGASMEVNMISTEAPTAKFSDQSLKVTLMGTAIFRAHLPDGKLVDCLKTEVTLETTVQLQLRLEKLMGTVTSILPTSITVVKSALESVNRKVLKEVFDLIAKQFLSHKLEEITQKGIPLPRPLLSGVEEFENVEVRAAGDVLRIDTDLKFNA